MRVNEESKQQSKRPNLEANFIAFYLFDVCLYSAVGLLNLRKLRSTLHLLKSTNFIRKLNIWWINIVWHSGCYWNSKLLTKLLRCWLNKTHFHQLQVITIGCFYFMIDLFICLAQIPWFKYKTKKENVW